MKKINSIGYGHIILAVSAVFLIAVPLAVYLLSKLFLHSALALLLIKISLAVGALVFAGLILLLIIELTQDKKVALYFSERRDTKAKLPGGRYECQSCGNRKLSENDHVCPVCGAKFR